MQAPGSALWASAAEPKGRAGVAQFFIPAAASLQERRPRTLKHDDMFGVFDHNGDVISGPGSPEGLFYRDTRYLSHFYLTIGGVRPMLLSSTSRDDNATLTCDLTNPDLFDGNGKLTLGHDLIHLRRSRFLWDGTCFERLSVINFDEQAQHVEIAFSFGADFADLFEVRGVKRNKRGKRHPPTVARDSTTLAYTGLDDRIRKTKVAFDPAPAEITDNQATFKVDLQPRQRMLLFVAVCCHSKSFSRRGFFIAFRDARRASRASAKGAVSISSSNDIFNEALRRSVSDLRMLITDMPEGRFPYAGIPWFSAPFGRDALITALQTLWLDPSIARGVLGFLAAHQAHEFDPKADAEPGKIMHEMRHGEMAALGEVPFGCYYGSVDATPLFVMLAGAYLERTGDLPLVQSIWSNVEAALKWIDEEGDRDGDGFVEYGRRTGEGLANQGWKDSQDSVFHADGALARAPIALVEVQAFVYGAWRAAASIASALALNERASELESKASALKDRFDAAFFDNELGTYVLALDADKKPCRVRTSNAGYALFTGIAFTERAAAVVSALLDDDSFCGWGVRTLACKEPRYNPMSYHNGSVWPHDNSLIAAGFARYGYQQEAARIFAGLFAASCYVDLRRLPELFCGFPRQPGRGPTFYPVACEPQAWASGAPLFLVQSCLCLGFDVANRQITFERPVLPDFLDEIVLRGLSIDTASADISIRRSGKEVVVNVLGRNGNVRIMTTS